MKTLFDKAKDHPLISMFLLGALLLGGFAGARANLEEIRWWASRSELNTLQLATNERFQDVDIQFESARKQRVKLNINILTGQLFNVEREMRQYEGRGELIPDSLRREKRRLETEINDARNDFETGVKEP